MASVTVKYDGKVRTWGHAFGEVGPKAGVLLAQSLNREMRKGRTQMRRVVADVTGASYGRVSRVMRDIAASAADPRYTLTSTDAAMGLEEFKARETRAGVSAAPWGTRRVFPTTFQKGGAFPKRVPLGMGNRVFSRTGPGRLPIERHFGPAVPNELVRDGGRPLATWNAFAADVPDAVLREINRRLALGGLK